ncbi:MAG: shikimate dehydrogenase [Armatimonadota bacterium]|nr:shikimate dehydrogenase [Armatimonadota bacterium]
MGIPEHWRIDGETRVVGIIGDPVSHSLSPPMHNAAFAHYGMNWCYLPFPVSPSLLPDAIRGLRALGVVGVNVTIPHKEPVLPLLDEVEEEAKMIGAVNTIHIVEGKCLGYNTDVSGFREALRSEARFVPTGRRVAVLGAGGGARAVCAAVAREGAEEVIILNRTLARARRLADDLARLFPQVRFFFLPLEGKQVKELLPSCDLVVQATSLGMKGEGSPLQDPTVFHEGMVVVDLVYHPPETPFLRMARERGAKTVNGLSMLVYQGARSFEIWTGRPAPIAVMKQVVGLWAHQREE